MVAPAAVRTYRQTQVGIVRLAEKDLRAFWLSLDHEDAKRTTRALKVYVSALVDEYGSMTAAAAVDFFEEARATSESKKLKRYKPVIVMAPQAQIDASVNWAVGPLWGVVDKAKTFRNLQEINDKLVKAPARNTLEENMHNDPNRVRYARVPGGSEPCDFCEMLASRGAVYISEESAGGIEYHARCNCTAVPVYDELDLEILKNNSGYDPDALYEKYQGKQ